MSKTNRENYRRDNIRFNDFSNDNTENVLVNEKIIRFKNWERKKNKRKNRFDDDYEDEE